MKSDAILLINADPQVKETATKAVHDTEYTLRIASSSEEAFRLLSDGTVHFKMIVLDLSHEIHGLTLLHALEYRSGEIPLVVLTDLEKAYMDPLVKRKGAVACLEKPLSVDKLRDQINRFCSLTHSES